jgi:hypothetical protein
MNVSCWIYPAVVCISPSIGTSQADPMRKLPGALPAAHRLAHRHSSIDPPPRIVVTTSSCGILDKASRLHGFLPITTGIHLISKFMALPLTRTSAMTAY